MLKKISILNIIIHYKMEYIGIAVIVVIIFVFIGTAYTYRYFRCLRNSNDSNESASLIESWIL